MPEYRITFARSARKELQSISHPFDTRILEKIETLVSNPRPDGCKKLQGQSNLWRIRINDYRVIYSIDDENHTIDVSVIRHRSEAYN